jgi:peptidoglycan/xylan/chitin deacetylase (PgdA/CDA1 family)
MGTEQSFPHDIGKDLGPLANMSWDQLRAMRAEGFTIGSHTVSHIDCAREPEATVRQELRQSMDTLRTELGIDQVILAYPYGGRDNMTPARLEFVRQAGYVGCLAAYGGFNKGPVDRFNVLRCGVNWTFSDLAFRSRVFGVR